MHLCCGNPSEQIVEARVPLLTAERLFPDVETLVSIQTTQIGKGPVAPFTAELSSSGVDVLLLVPARVSQLVEADATPLAA